MDELSFIQVRSIELHKHEYCYNPANIAPLSKFTELFLNLWQLFAKNVENKFDFEISDASLVSHMKSDLVRNYNASEVEMVRHLETLLETINHLKPNVFYLSSYNERERLIKARQSHGQTTPTNEQTALNELIII